MDRLMDYHLNVEETEALTDTLMWRLKHDDTLGDHDRVVLWSLHTHFAEALTGHERASFENHGVVGDLYPET